MKRGGYGWIEGEGLLDPLIPLREAILRGDLRSLYLFWLWCAHEQAGWAEKESEEHDPLIEPPVPSGLVQLDPALQAFAEFFAVDQDLITAAAETSPKLTSTDEPVAQWVKLLPADERDTFLLRVAQGESHVGIALLRRLREVGGASKPTVALPQHRAARSPNSRLSLSAKRNYAFSASRQRRSGCGWKN